MRRREFVTLLGGATVAWPLAARAQQPDRMRLIGVLMGFAANDPGARPQIMAFEKSLAASGWMAGQNVQINYRWTAGDANRMRSDAQELVASSADVILATSTAALKSLQQATHTIPLVFVQVSNPVVAGFVASLSRPGGNITGVSNPDVSVVGERLGLLKEMVPSVTRALVLLQPDYPTVPDSLRAIESVGTSLGIVVTRGEIRNADDTEKSITAFAREPNGGLLVIQSPPLIAARQRIIAAASQHGLPGVYPLRVFAASGGLAFYGSDTNDTYAQAAAYVDRILRGQRPADLPIEYPAKLRLVINVKAANSFKLEIPAAVLARADEVIE